MLYKLTHVGLSVKILFPPSCHHRSLSTEQHNDHEDLECPGFLKRSDLLDVVLAHVVLRM